MHCSDPNCRIRGHHTHDSLAENSPGELETLRQQLQDFESENATLREAISDAWQTYNTCQEALTEARAETQELSTQNKILSQYLMDTGVGFECQPGCSESGHEALCPAGNPVAAWRLIRIRVQELTSQLDHALAEVAELRRATGV